MVVVTGATGHLGGVLVRELLRAGEDVRVITRPESNLSGIRDLPVEVHPCGLFDPNGLRKAMEGAAVVYHAAALISIGSDDEEELGRVNVDGTVAVLEAARAASVGRMVHVSSIEAFPLTERIYPVTEDQGVDPDHTVMPYGISKARATNLVIEAARNGFDAVVVCPTSFLGPPDVRFSPMGRMVFDFARRKLPAYVTGGFDFVDVRDVARGVLLAGARGRTGESYLLGGEHHTIPELMDMLEQISGVKKPRLCFPASALLPLMPIVEAYYGIARKPPRFTRGSLHILGLDVQVSSAKAKRELGYEPRSLSCTLYDLLAWYQATGRLQLRDGVKAPVDYGACPEDADISGGREVFTKERE